MRPSSQPSLQPGHGRPPFGFHLGSIYLFRDHSAYQIRLLEPQNVTKYSLLALSHHTSYLVYPSVTKNSIIGDKAVAMIDSP